MTSESTGRLFTLNWFLRELQFQPFLSGDCVLSEPFTIPSLGYTRWRMELYPKGKEISLQPQALSLYLRRLPSESVHYEYSYKDEVVVSVKVAIWAKLEEDLEEEINVQQELGREEIELGREEIDLGREEIELGREEIEVGREEIEVGREEIEVGREEIEVGREEKEVGREEKEVGREAEEMFYKKELHCEKQATEFLMNKRFKIFDTNGTDINIGVLNKDLDTTKFVFGIICEFFLGNIKISNGVSDYMSLSNDLKELLNSQHHTDLVLSCQGREFKVHRCVIACRASQLDELWGLNAMTQNEIITVNVTNILFNVLQTILVFIYTGVVDIRPSEVTQELEDAANEYGLEDLLRKIKRHPSIIRMNTRFTFGTEDTELTLIKGDGIEERTYVEEIKTEGKFYFDSLVLTCYTPPNFLRGLRSEIRYTLHFVGFKKDLPVEVAVDVWFDADEDRWFENGIETYRCLLSDDGECTQTIDIDSNKLPPNPKITLHWTIYIPDAETKSPISTDSLDCTDTCTCGFFKLIDDFSRLLDEPLYTDFKIICNSEELNGIDELNEIEEFNVHKCILVARSQYFRALLAHEFKESQIGVTSVYGIRPENMRVFLNYIYKNIFPSMEYESAKELYKEADKCNMRTLKGKCREALIENVNDQNFADFKAFAEFFPDLKTFCNQWSGNNT